jgi:hypothetical protein
MTTSTRSMQKVSPATLSVWIVSALTILALLLGTDLKNMAENQTRLVDHAGVTAQLPAGWIVEKGIAGEQTVFTARDPFSANLSYTASLVPSSADIKPSDLAFTFDLQRGQDVTLFRTIDQSQEKVNGKDVLRVHYAYVNPKSQAALPVVVEGVEYIFISQPNALIVAMEDETSQFADALPSFMSFLKTVKYAAGGNQ